MGIENQKIKMLIGPTNSGKTSWSFNFLQQEENIGKWMRVNRDDIRHMLLFQAHLDNAIGEKLVSKIIHSTIQEILSFGFNVLLDNCHCRMSYIEEIVELYGENCDIEFEVFKDLSIEELEKRAIVRSEWDHYPPVGIDVITRMHKNFQILKTQFDFRTIKKGEKL